MCAHVCVRARAALYIDMFVFLPGRMCEVKRVCVCGLAWKRFCDYKIRLEFELLTGLSIL